MGKEMAYDIRPRPFESYSEWKKRRRMAWLSKMSYSDRKKIDEFLTKLTLFREETKNG